MVAPNARRLTAGQFGSANHLFIMSVKKSAISANSPNGDGPTSGSTPKKTQSIRKGCISRLSLPVLSGPSMCVVPSLGCRPSLSYGWPTTSVHQSGSWPQDDAMGKAVSRKASTCHDLLAGGAPGVPLTIVSSPIHIERQMGVNSHYTPLPSCCPALVQLSEDLDRGNCARDVSVGDVTAFDSLTVNRRPN